MKQDLVNGILDGFRNGNMEEFQYMSNKEMLVLVEDKDFFEEIVNDLNENYADPIGYVHLVFSKFCIEDLLDLSYLMDDTDTRGLSTLSEGDCAIEIYGGNEEDLDNIIEERLIEYYECTYDEGVSKVFGEKSYYPERMKDLWVEYELEHESMEYFPYRNTGWFVRELN